MRGRLAILQAGAIRSRGASLPSRHEWSCRHAHWCSIDPRFVRASDAKVSCDFTWANALFRFNRETVVDTSPPQSYGDVFVWLTFEAPNRRLQEPAALPALSCTSCTAAIPARPSTPVLRHGPTMNPCWHKPNLPRHQHRLHSLSILFAATAYLIVADTPLRRYSEAEVVYAQSGLVAAYSFDEGSGSSLNDASGNANNGVVSGATWSTCA